ncbi:MULTISPECIES: polysaccharide biosynthesis tyrosine autokinase [unclassified Variovorax]|uniref:polysaccharide biosynthesis tyrosine autokinase n=1 Tax=unclassified Variovorax TaxID=663243 RepID=UPI0025755BEE|nr:MULTISPECIES: polysaccharide biosynthesis tyrosine autokinase [unclassified Variovorax]MDM0090595.1 polysaccharide biosynthesis tyrosine autokinase [Variovorax sp. J22G40]MDM0147740.1 polysaccharide biosynthesis tyrosine autokinase [Variovorax sp. J2P1-31]
MTSSAAAPLPPQNPAAHDDEINLSEYADILLDRKWLVAGVTAAAVALGAAYALLSTPVYQSNLLVQVEDSAPDAKGFLGDSASLFDVKTPATGEIQIIRSRLVLGAAVDQTKLYIDATPRYLPFIGRWMANRSTALSTPGFLGMAGYVSGKERIEVAKFDVPVTLEDGKPFIITALGDGRYTLSNEDLGEVLTGTVGQPLVHNSTDGIITLLIAELDGKPGAQFLVSRNSRLGTVEGLQRRLQLAEQGKQSNVISVTLDDNDRPRLARILNAIGEQYVRQNVERKAAEAQKTLGFLDEQLPAFKRQLEASEDAYTKFRNKNGTVAFDEEAKGVLSQSIELQTKLLEAQQQRRALAAKYTDINPRIKTIDGQIGAIESELGTLNNRVSGMPTVQRDALRLERDVRVNGELYKSLLNSALQLRLVKEGKVGNVRLLDKAVQPKRAIKPQKSLILALALVLGLLAGSALAIVRSLFMGGIRNPDEIEAHTGLNVYSVVPFTAEQVPVDQRNASSVQLLAVLHPESPAIEALRSLRIALQFATLEAGNNRVMITGATPGVGKSFISANFAAIMAAAGKRVLLIDADMRKGHIHQELGMKRENGLSELLAGVLTPAQAIRTQVLPNLDVLTTGKLPSNPADMMMSETFSRLLDTLSEQYELVIIDTPPVLVAADAAAVAPHAGVVLLVARADQTQLGELNESAKRLAHAGKTASGVLFNAMDMTRRHYGSYGYKYGGYRYTEYKYKT